MNLCLAPTTFNFKRTTSITTIQDPKTEKPTPSSPTNPLMKKQLQKINVVIRQIGEVTHLKSREIQSFDVVCAICASPEIARACCGFADLVQIGGNFVTSQLISGLADLGTMVEIVLNSVNLRHLDVIRRNSKNGKNVIFTAPQMSDADKMNFLKVFGVNLTNVKRSEKAFLMNCASRKFKFCDGVGFME